MEYEGLTRGDLTNVRALNRAWLRLEMRGKRFERLVAAPFLLFSFREQDDGWWQCLLNEGQQQDLLDERPRVTGERQALQAAGLAFLWELARRNPYVARVVSGASLHWCERIASETLVRVLECAANRDMVEPRFDYSSRVFSEIGALHALLTSGQDTRYERMAAAACRMPAVQQVADEV